MCVCVCVCVCERERESLILKINVVKMFGNGRYIATHKR